MLLDYIVALLFTVENTSTSSKIHNQEQYIQHYRSIYNHINPVDVGIIILLCSKDHKSETPPDKAPYTYTMYSKFGCLLVCVACL